MTLLALAGTLALLALVDSTSVGTLVIPIWLLLASRRPPVGRVLLYLGVVAVLYFALGVAVLLGAGFVIERAGGALESTMAYVLQAAVGVGLVVLSFVVEPTTAGRRRRAERDRAQAEARGEDPAARGGRLARWRERVTDSPSALVGVAVAAVGMEVATMLPYLGAIGLLTAHVPDVLSRVGMLAAYCGVMVLPALALLGLRRVASSWIEGPLRRVEAWAERSGSTAMGWILGVLGVVLAMQAIGVLNHRGVLG